MVHKQMKKVLIVIACCFMLTGCSNEEKNKAPEERSAWNMNPQDYTKELKEKAGRFTVISLPQEYFALRNSKIIVDNQTRVQYFYHPGTTSHTMTVLVLRSFTKENSLKKSNSTKPQKVSEVFS